MTRKQSLNDLESYKYTSQKSSDPLGKWEDVRYLNAKAIVNEIYDDFESMTCENCKFNETESYCLSVCINPHSIAYNRNTANNDGCNKWEKKDD